MPAETPKSEPIDLVAQALQPRPSRIAPKLRQFKFYLLAIYQAFVLFVNRLYVHYRVEVDEKSKCPACGKRLKHRIVFSAIHQALVHQCVFCSAAWGERPIVPATSWHIAGLPQDEQPTVQHTERPQVASRVPVRIEPLEKGASPKPVMYN
jgi:hypothetical protein